MKISQKRCEKCEERDRETTVLLLFYWEVKFKI